MKVAGTNELVERLSAAVAMIMEDQGAVALTPLPVSADEAEARLSDLDQACQDAATLMQAARVLSRRGIH
jgi:hypothetical protein